jgi:tetratricopeptide (TPR) repeat protein
MAAGPRYANRVAPSDRITVEIDRIRDLNARRYRSLAEERLERLLVEHAEDRRVRLLQVQCLNEWNDLETARSVIQSLIEESPDDLDLLQQAVPVMAASGRRGIGLALADRLLAIDPANSQVLAGAADMLEREGRLDESEWMLDRYERSPMRRGSVAAHLRARLLFARRRENDAIVVLRDHIDSIDLERVPGTRVAEVVEMHFLLAKISDRIGDYDAAWSAASEAHRIDGKAFQIDVFRRTLADQRSVFTRESTRLLARADEIETEPLIIMGNPRSGTTLLDQIIGMHPQARAGGELAASQLMAPAAARLTDSYLPYPMNVVDLRVADANALGSLYQQRTDGLRQGCRYLSNKSLAMQVHLGLLSLCLPRLRVINLFRHPLDNCVSCYTTNLLASGHSYTNRLDWLAEVWKTRYEMQRFWPEVLEVPFLELHYEDLVANQESETRRILDFLDVPFDKACLEFHTSMHAATTLSYDQVTQSMYSTSKGRWRHYEQHLEPLIDALEPYL